MSPENDEPTEKSVGSCFELGDLYFKKYPPLEVQWG